MAPRVVVGMSGGVDSSVAALLLKERGYDVVGLFMKNWEETRDDGVCPAEEDYADVAAVCRQIDIPYTSVNFSQEYAERVFASFLKDYQNGLTPNPDVLCNREIKFDFFAKHARALGADFIATGHYARLEGGRLLKGLDPGKDQSYFLHAVPAPAFERVLFPVGELPKSRVRELAQAAGLATAKKKDSTGICFIGERDFREFLSRYLAARPGPVRDIGDPQGDPIGTHAGVAYYTLGQRKGLGIGGGTTEPYFVVSKDPQTNTLYVARGEDHPALYCSEVWVDELNWLGPPPEPGVPLRVASKLRYRQTDQAATLTREADGRVRLQFDSPQRAATPGQFAVFYLEAVCLGGGVIRSTK